jgi:glycosyltransferase involved in cell wall biosynthesis
MQENKMFVELPLLSIVIPCFNDAQYVEQSVNSALNQTYSNKEVIVVDDGSNIETKEVLRKLESQITKLITQENQGQSTARNVGIREAKGELVLVLDSDDFFEPTFCEKAAAVFLSNLDIKIVTCYGKRIYVNNKTDIFKPHGGQIKDFLFNNCATGSAMIKKFDWNKINGYDEKMRSGFEDWEFYIRLLEDEGSAHVIAEPLFNYRLRGNSTTSKANKIKYELLQYIYFKHQDLFKANYELLIRHLLGKIEREEIEKIKNSHRIESKIGRKILQPLRYFKRLLK